MLWFYMQDKKSSCCGAVNQPVQMASYAVASCLQDKKLDKEFGVCGASN
jgi:hypothetical protein